MNYLLIYDSIINRSRNRELIDGTYYEVHHILPRCMFGKDVPENKVALTYREHFIAHWLLHKIYPYNKKIFKTFKLFAYGFKEIITEFVPSSRILESKRISNLKGKPNLKNVQYKLKSTGKTNKKRNGTLEKYLVKFGMEN